MRDGDAHPDAIEEILSIAERGTEFKHALGALIRKRRNTVLTGTLDSGFEAHDLSPGITCHSVNHCAGWAGITAVFIVEEDALRLLSVVAFDDFMAEAMSGWALQEALRLAKARI
ncbi:MAG: hypothetical protein ACYC0F_05810 [Rhodanobacter sp.]